MKTLDEVMREHIFHVLEVCKGNRMEAAKILGIARRTVMRYANGYVPPKGQKSEQYLNQLEKEDNKGPSDEIQCTN
jgi:DNA-binding NtrC family response regulator